MPEESAQESPAETAPPPASEPAKRRPRTPRPPKGLDEVAPVPPPRVKTRTESETVPQESKAEEKERLRSRGADDDLRRRKDEAIFWVFLGLVVLTFLGTLAVMWIPGVPPQRVTWAENTFFAIASGAISYFVGKAKGETKD